MANSKQIVYLSQAQYAELIANGSITVDGVTVTYDENDIYVTPQVEPVTDVRMNNASITSSGVANIPLVVNRGTAGIVKVNQSLGVTEALGTLTLSEPNASTMKEGGNAYYAISPKHQHEAAFYGLAKAAGHDEKNSTESLGTYTPEAKGAIQKMLGVSDLIATEENNLIASKAYAIGDVFTANGKLYKATAVIAADAAIIPAVEGEEVAGANCVETSVGEGFPHDVQINGTSIVSSGVANIPLCSTSTYGVIKPHSNSFTFYDGALRPRFSSVSDVKGGSDAWKSLNADLQHAIAFYGLAKASGDTTQSASSNAVGQYTDNAKASIKAMLGIQDGSTGTVDISGTDPVIAAVENTRYVCGEVTSLSFTPPASGISIVRFTSGSTVTVLTLPSTVKFPEWFDSTSLETNTIYEICITDGIYGAVMSWAL